MDCSLAFKNEVMMLLVNGKFDMETIKAVEDSLSMVLINYEITEKERGLIVYNENNFKYLELFLMSKKVEGKTEKTIKRYKYVLTKFIQETIDVSINQINQFHIRKYLMILKTSSIRKKELSNTSVDGERKIIVSFFNWLEYENILEKSPAKKITRVKNDTVKEAALTNKEMELIFSTTTNVRDLAICSFLKDTACRAGELTTIKLKDISFDNNRCVLHGKGEKDRTVFYSERTSVYINEYFKLFNTKYGITFNPEHNLFLSFRTKKGISADSLRGMLTKIGATSNITHLHPHRFRVTTITNMIDKGMPLEKVKEFVGHTDINTTIGYYRGSSDNVKIEYNKIYN